LLRGGQGGEIAGDEEGVVHASGGKLDLRAIAIAAQEDADGWKIALGLHVGLEPVHVKVHLAGISGLEGTDFQINEDVAAESTVVEDEIHPVVPASFRHAELAGLEAEACPQFQQEALEVIQERGLQIILGVGGEIGKAGEFEDVGIPQHVGDGLFVRKGAPFVPHLHGGHQERGRRGGTENVAGIVGLGCAAELAHAELPRYEASVRALRDRLESDLLARVPNAERNGHATERLPNTTNMTFRGVESEALLLLLDQSGICASAGSACLADSDEPSHVVRAMKPEGGASRQRVRFSLGTANTSKEVDAAIAAVVRVTQVLRGSS
jgi:Aminotransferase class-V